jgi:hypothetical protein
LQNPEKITPLLKLFCPSSVEYKAQSWSLAREVESLPSKLKALGSITSTVKQINKQKKFLKEAKNTQKTKYKTQSLVKIK